MEGTRIYLDNAATTPVLVEVMEAMLPFYKEMFGNPSSIHKEGRQVRMAIEGARKTVAKGINASLSEVFFTSCATEANNMVIKNAIRDAGVTRIISSPTEHHCVLHTLEAAQRDFGVKVDMLKLDNKGRPSLSHLKEMLIHCADKTLVSLMHANNETGLKIDLQAISALCEEYGALLHSDTVQTIGRFPLDVQILKIHFLSGSAHKFHGPKGVGFVYINSDVSLLPYIDGGAQERNMRSGTENVAGIVGMAKALELALEGMDERKSHITSLRSYLATELKKHFPTIRVISDLEGDSLYTVLSVGFPKGGQADLLTMHLDIEGVAVSGGSACSSGADKGSHVMEAMFPDDDFNVVRFSFSHLNTKEEVDFAIGKLVKIIDN